ncbi:MAG: RES domain-containing protein [Acidobacteria bacterium]|nr:RES domain-containing protein [Acidobacteriota bacterium]MYJ03833.1 RES domain-containing protein [Acidobacteriota bacterium]
MRFRGIAYQAHDPRWSWNPLSGEGARRYGGRFNRRGVAALYLSLFPITAIREAQPAGRPMQPLTLCAYRVDAEPVFDALSAMDRQAFGVSDAELRCPTWELDMRNGRIPASQGLSDQLIEAGYVGLRVRSYAPGSGPDDTNVVFWKWGSRRPSQVVLIDDERRLRSGPESA